MKKRSMLSKILGQKTDKQDTQEPPVDLMAVLWSEIKEEKKRAAIGANDDSAKKNYPPAL